MQDAYVFDGRFATDNSDDADVFSATVWMKIADSAPRGFKEFFYAVWEYDDEFDDGRFEKRDRIWDEEHYTEVDDVLFAFPSFFEVMRVEEDFYGPFVSLDNLLRIEVLGSFD